MAEMAGRKELALGHQRAFYTKNGRKWLLDREETKRKWRFKNEKQAKPKRAGTACSRFARDDKELWSQLGGSN
jgi:hypothetical protein